MTFPTPPRTVGDSARDSVALTEWAWGLYRELVVENRVVDRLNAIKAVGQLTQTISATPTQAEVEAVQEKLNAIIAAADVANL